jgi:predicted CXXCH cytochrome family protein
VKRIAFVLLTACAIVFATNGVALADFGPHGGYASDTDSCAECHRAHTATSNVTWTDNQGGQKTALLISDSVSMTDFCYACHGDGAVGAATDVESGYFEGANSTVTHSSDEATLNGGGFARIGGLAGTPNSKTVMSSHGVTGNGSLFALDAFVRWGDANNSVLTPMAAFTCTDCHDPHGSSNYRILKDVVNGQTVGGYVGTTDTPNPWVISNEDGYPQGGFKKRTAGMADIAAYVPNYTSAQYAKNVASTKSTSAWCGACHTVYVQPDSTYNYQGKIAGPLGATSTLYHRHLVDVALSVGTAASPEDRALITQLVDDPGLPLEMGKGQTAVGFSYSTPGAQIWDDRGNVSCLTCHRAHGTQATMSGWAATSLGADGLPRTQPSSTLPLADKQGVDPTFDSALLRYDNRGVCERCHNK